MKYFIIGSLIGIVSFIPGISGGTIFYLTGEFDNFTHYLKNIKKDYPKILSLLLGGSLGIILFAKIIEFAFRVYPNITKLFFAYLVLFSLPSFLKKENLKIKPVFLFLSLFSLIFIAKFIPVRPIIYTNINITIPFLLFFLICGFLDGFITIIPGISGSMIMMILGPYYLYKSICANILNNPLYLIPLLFYFLGDFTGIFFGAKFTSKIINKYQNISHSIIFGFIAASILIIIPFKEIFTLSGFIVLFLAYIIINLTTLNT